MNVSMMIFTLIALASGPASAESWPRSSAGDCRTYARPSVEVPAASEGVFKFGRTLRVCKYADHKPTRYVMRSRPWKGQSKICHFEGQELYEFTTIEDKKVLLAESLKSNDRLEIRRYMVVSQGACPSADDNSYVYTRGVSEGVFASLMELLERLTSSEQSFQNACKLRHPKFEIEVPYAELKAFIGSSAPDVTVVRLLDIGNQGFGSGPFEIILRSRADKDKFVVVSADLSRDKMCLIGTSLGFN